MENSIKNYLSFFLKNNTYRNFFYFFLISLSLWFFSRLSDNYAYNLKIPVKYIDKNNKVYPGNFNKDTLTLEIETSGFQLLKIKMKKPIFFYKLENPGTKTWFPPHHKKEINGLLGKGVKILEINPAKIDIGQQNISQKVVPVKINIDIQFEDGYKNPGEAKTEPSQIIIYGQKEELKKIEEIGTKPYRFTHVKEDVNEKLELVFPENIQSNTKFVRYRLPVDQLVEKQQKLPVQIPARKEGGEWIILPKYALVTYTFFKKDYPEVKNKKLILGINKKDLAEKKEKIRLELVDKPAAILHYNIQPPEVNILIKEKNND